MRIGMEKTKGLRYKLRMMGVLIDGPTLVFFDNKLVVISTSVPNLTSAKKHLVVFYHAVREAVDVGIHCIVRISGEYNPVYVLTKILMAEVKRPHIGRILYK